MQQLTQTVSAKSERPPHPPLLASPFYHCHHALLVTSRCWSYALLFATSERHSYASNICWNNNVAFSTRSAFLSG